MTAKKLIISSDPYETRVALIEDGKPAEFFSEIKDTKAHLQIYTRVQ